jgi:hypothetical protein
MYAPHQIETSESTTPPCFNSCPAQHRLRDSLAKMHRLLVVYRYGPKPIVTCSLERVSSQGLAAQSIQRLRLSFGDDHHNLITQLTPEMHR